MPFQNTRNSVSRSLIARFLFNEYAEIASHSWRETVAIVHSFQVESSGEHKLASNALMPLLMFALEANLYPYQKHIKLKHFGIKRIND